MNTIEKLAIVGGGSSAWLTAAYLSKQCPNIKITVIDKEIGNPIGVGEGTLLSFQKFMEDCGFKIDDWFCEVDATYKTGALFPDWLEIGHNIWHPFTMSPAIDDSGVTLQSCWSHYQDHDIKLYGTCLYETAVDYNLIDSSIIDGYGFHVDAGKLVQFFQKHLVNKIEFIASEVTTVNKKENGEINSLLLANGDAIFADLFIDCTGFKSLLRDDATRVELLGRVFCDTAVCGQVHYQDINTEMRPYTRAQAVDHGWIWTIPTQSRMGSGIIFNRKITDIDEAKDYLVEYWGGRIKKEDLRIIDWTPYYVEDPWRGNIVSIGMSSGFIEPLESTGLALVQYQAHSLSNIIKSGFWRKENVIIYNIEFKLRFEDCVDFVSAHYSRTNRTEKFWEYVKNTYKHTENIKSHLMLLEKNGPRHGNQQQYVEIFTGTNWTTWMAQLGYPIGIDRSITRDRAGFLLDRHIQTFEKYRKNWSQHHATEISRSKEHKLFYKDNITK